MTGERSRPQSSYARVSAWNCHGETAQQHVGPQMNLRPDGLAWFKKNRGTAEPVRVSRLYPPAQSPTGKPLWWFEFRESLVAQSSWINLLSQHPHSPGEFIHLRVPQSHFVGGPDRLGFRPNAQMYSLFLSAEPESLFMELRGPAKSPVRGIRGQECCGLTRRWSRRSLAAARLSLAVRRMVTSRWR